MLCLKCETKPGWIMSVPVNPNSALKDHTHLGINIFEKEILPNNY